MSQVHTGKIPIVYRVVFILFDILMPIGGIFVNTFKPEVPLSGYTPNIVRPIPPETLVTLDGFSGFFAALIFLNVYLLVYRPNDVTVWKGLAAAVMLQDIFMLGGFSRELKLRNGDWRGEDYSNLVGYTIIATIRALFVMGVGVKDGAKSKTK